MKSMRLNFTQSAIALGMALLSGCTSNPFGGDDISSGKGTIRGTMQLADGASPEGGCVWLEGFKIGTRVDGSGKFQITLPPPSAQGPTGGVSGVFNLYFYMANYQLATAEVATQSGNFFYQRGAVNGDGEVSPIALRKFLRILTEVLPDTVPSNYTHRIGVQVTLEAPIDSVSVVFPSAVGGLLGAVLFRNVVSGEVLTFATVVGGPDDAQVVQRGGVHVRVLAFTLDGILGLVPGRYEVIPHLLIRHNALPEGLFSTLGADVEKLGPNYFKIPMIREGGNFLIID